jgi:hypothetical protein
MAVDAFIRLDGFRCLAEADGLPGGGSEPYAWTTLVWIDDTTLMSSIGAGSRSPDITPGHRAVIKNRIKAGESAEMPERQREFVHRFEANLSVRHIGIVVALFEKDETPEDAVRAGYRAFTDEVPRAIGQFVLTNLRPPTDQEQQQIASQVEAKVRSAIEGGLSAFEKTQIFLGFLNLDDTVATDNRFFEIVRDTQPDHSVVLDFDNQGGEFFGSRYRIFGRFGLRRPPGPDPCQDQVDRVREASDRVEGLQQDILNLQDELQSGEGSKPDIIDQINQIKQKDLPDAVDALQDARQALASCREGT